MSVNPVSEDGIAANIIVEGGLCQNHFKNYERLRHDANAN